MSRIVPQLTKEQYAIERAICDKAEAYARATMATRGKYCNYLTADEAKHPDYAACDNDMRGRVEQYELLTEMPHTIVAYVGEDNATLQVWTGLAIGTVRETSRWRSHYTWRYQYHARIGNNVYTGRSRGAGWIIVLRYSEKLSRR